MKPKKNLNKLTLKKETISNLNQREMTKVQGGVTTEELTCVGIICTDSCAYTCTCTQAMELDKVPPVETACC